MRRSAVILLILLLLAGYAVWRGMRSGQGDGRDEKTTVTMATEDNAGGITEQLPLRMNIAAEDLLSRAWTGRVEVAIAEKAPAVPVETPEAATPSPVFLAYLQPRSMLSTGMVETVGSIATSHPPDNLMAVLGAAPSPGLRQQILKSIQAATSPNATSTLPTILEMFGGKIGEQRKPGDRASFDAADMQQSMAKAMYHIREADGRMDQGDLMVALAGYKQAIELFPDMTYANQQAGRISLLMARYDDAVLYLKAALVNAQDVTFTLNDLGIAYLYAGQPLEAEDMFRAAIKSDSLAVDPVFNLGFTLRRLNRHDEARAQYENCLGIDPSDARPHREIAMLDALEGKRDPALERLRRAMELNPTWAQPRLDTALLLAETGDFEKAVGQLLRSLDFASAQEVYQVYRLPVFNTFRLSPEGRPFEARLAERAREQATGKP